jgi:hypothetical protein
VVATNHDEATGFIRPAADEVQALVAHRGFDFLHLLDDQASRDDLERELAAHRARPSDIAVAFFLAHGSNTCLWREHNNVTQPVFDVWLRDHFDGAILILCACLYDGLFSAQLVAPHGPAQAVIGYKPCFVVPYLANILAPNTPQFAYNQQRFLQVLLEPIRSLAQANVTVGEAEQRTRRAWENLGNDMTVDPRLRMTGYMNSGWVYSDGLGDAVLP